MNLLLKLVCGKLRINLNIELICNLTSFIKVVNYVGIR